MNLEYYVEHCRSCDSYLSEVARKEGVCSDCGCEFSVAQRKYAKENPEVYLSIMQKVDGEACTVLEAADGLVDGKILEVYGVFAVTDSGIECLNHFYAIDSSDLGDPDWPRHMSEKTWVVPSDFEKALDRARAVHGFS
ncbi:MAG: hypothetical protein ACJAY7_001748 [Pseudohongiellaceae bacterium]|jgi:hypothetical protein